MISSHLGWPKQTDEDVLNDKPEPSGYGDLFRKHGFLPPAWKRSDVGVDDDTTCGISDLVRNGMISAKDGSRKYAIEPLMEQYGVQLYLTGHEHNYERTYPVLNGTHVESYEKVSERRKRSEGGEGRLLCSSSLSDFFFFFFFFFFFLTNKHRSTHVVFS